MKTRARLLTASASVLVLSLLSSGALAATYYVSPTGGDQGAASDSPTTPQSALDRAAAGDVIIFLDGTYTQPMELTRSGSAGSPITLRADAGKVPVIRGPGSGTSDGISATQDVSHYVIEGLWFDNWGTGGIGLDWDNRISDIVIRYCVADFNLRNGIAPYYATNVTVEYNIASRNGWGPDSWSSNFNIFAVQGTQNVVRGNIAFHGIDTSSNRSDGNGFILDLTIDKGGALFENNLAFANGGACISVTDSGGAQLVGNTCFGNSQDAADYMDEFNFGNTCRAGLVSNVPVNASAFTFRDLVTRNNVVVPTANGKDGINTYSSSPCEPSQDFVNESNYIQSGVGTALFENPAAADFRPKAGSAIVDQVAPGNTAKSDIGFDPKCIKTETDQSKKKYPFWTFAPDLEYMKSIGGIRNCFAPLARPQGANQDLGAYEFGERPTPNPAGGATQGGNGGTANAGGSGGPGRAGGSPSTGGGGTSSAGAPPVGSAGTLGAAGAPEDGSGGGGESCVCSAIGGATSAGTPAVSLLVIAGLAWRIRRRSATSVQRT